jgi:acyl carrier protein
MTCEINLQSIDSIRGWLIGWMANELNLEAREIEPDGAFLSYGMDSMSAMMLVGDLEGLIGKRLPPTLAWDYPTVNALAQHVVGEVATELQATPRERRSPASQSAAGNEADPRAVLTKLDGMSEADMDALLQQYLEPSR